MSASTFSTVNPTTGAEVETISFFGPGETEAVIAQAEASFGSYRKLSVFQRAELLSNLAAVLRRDKDQLARVITTEMGKILSERPLRWRSVPGKQSGTQSTDLRCLPMSPQ